MSTTDATTESRLLDPAWVAVTIIAAVVLPLVSSPLAIAGVIVARRAGRSRVMALYWMAIALSLVLVGFTMTAQLWIQPQ